MISTAAIAVNTESKKIKVKGKEIKFKVLSKFDSDECGHNQY
ncbi:MAG: hypothetical protein WCX82_02380 [archaeon]|jgi:hypothetical protein